MMRGRGPWWRHRLEEFGYRMTNPRQVVMSILRDTDKHLSAEDIYVKALEINPSIGLTTVYRTLDMFAHIGIVQKFDFGDGRARYELINNPLKKEHHHHLVCVKCKTIIDYSDFADQELELMQKTQESLSKQYDFQIYHHTISFYGVCRNCRDVV